MKPVLLIDFGSTYTKVTAADVEGERILGTASSYTTIETDVGEGLSKALALLEEGEGVPQQTVDFVRAYAARDVLGLQQVLTPMEKWKRDALVELLRAWQELMEQALACRAGLPAAAPLARELTQGRSAQELMNALKALQKGTHYAQSNVSPAAVCGWLAWELR